MDESWLISFIYSCSFRDVEWFQFLLVQIILVQASSVPGGAVGKTGVASPVEPPRAESRCPGEGQVFLRAASAPLCGRSHPHRLTWGWEDDTSPALCGSGVLRVYTSISEQEDLCIFNFCLADLISETFTYPEPAESPVSMPCASSEGKGETGLGLVTRKWTDWGNPGVRPGWWRRKREQKVGSWALQAAQPGEGQWSREHAGVRGEGWLEEADGAWAEYRKKEGNACWHEVGTEWRERHALDLFLNFRKMDWPNNGNGK